MQKGSPAKFRHGDEFHPERRADRYDNKDLSNKGQEIKW